MLKIRSFTLPLKSPISLKTARDIAEVDCQIVLLRSDSEIMPLYAKALSLEMQGGHVLVRTSSQ